MARPSKGPWLWEGRGYYVWHHGKRVFLDHSEEKAKKKWHRLQAGLPIDDEPSHGQVTFGDAADAYCREIERTRSASHLRGTAWRLNQISEHWGRKVLSSLRIDDVESLIEDKEKWGPTTQANVLTSLRGLLRWASRPGGLVAENPIPSIKLPRAETRVHVMTKAQVAKLLKAAGKELRTILKALADSGARPSELIRAKASDCDADGSAIRLPKGKQGRRIIFFPTASRPAMKTLRKVQEGGPLFTQPNGDAWSEYWLYSLAREARKAAKLPDWATCYALRHTWITERLREGVPIATVARMAGTSVTMIDRVYGHFADQDLRKVANKMG